LGVVDCYPKVVGWEHGVGFSALGIVDCWLCSTPRKLKEWKQVAVHFGPGVVGFWLVVGAWAQVVVHFARGFVCCQSCVDLQNLEG
jgi:hypothetical protein